MIGDNSFLSSHLHANLYRCSNVQFFLKTSIKESPLVGPKIIKDALPHEKVSGKFSTFSEHQEVIFYLYSLLGVRNSLCFRIKVAWTFAKGLYKKACMKQSIYMHWKISPKKTLHDNFSWVMFLFSSTKIILSKSVKLEKRCANTWKRNKGKFLLWIHTVLRMFNLYKNLILKQKRSRLVNSETIKKATKM